MERTSNILERANSEGKISNTAFRHVKKWLTDKEYLNYQRDIIKLVNDENFGEIENCFHTIIPFGTGGRRGICGIGPNRINTRTIGESSQGLASYIGRFGEDAKKRGVVIAYDTRNTSRNFSDVTAKVLTGNNIKTYLFEDFRSTPELSFAVRELKAIAGVVISASHNPPTDNGFKVYWEDGGQVIAPHDIAIMEEVGNVTSLNMTELAQAEQQGLLRYIGKDIDEQYLSKFESLTLSSYRDVGIVFSPLHGTGLTTVLPVLRRAGFRDIRVVEEQMSSDGNFPNVKNHFPNPERAEALEMAFDLAKKTDADIGIATDPDADRMGVFCRHADDDGNVRWIHLNGNQTGVLLTDYILTKLRDQGKLPKNGIIVKTMVTTDLISVIAKDFGMTPIGDLLVGFKYIGEVIENLTPDQEFVFGAEESVGYLRGTFVRDKDAATAALSFAELAAEAKARNKSVYDRLNEIYRKYGYYHEILKYVYFSGVNGLARVSVIMDSLRSQPLTKINGRKVTEVIDRKTGKVFDPETGVIIREVIGKKADVLVFVLSEDGHTRITIRPSGTEPTMKYYGAIKEDIPSNVGTQAELEQLKTEISKQLLSCVESFVFEAEDRGKS